jgi:hypothetical protein
MTRGSNRNGGRFRVTDDTAIPIGVDVEVRPEHLRALNAKENADETRKGHRRRIKKLIEWWMNEYPVYFEVGTRVFLGTLRVLHPCTDGTVLDNFVTC